MNVNGYQIEPEADHKGPCRDGCLCSKCGHEWHARETNDELKRLRKLNATALQEARARLRLTAQIQIEEIGADAPRNADASAREAVQLIKNLRVEIARLRGENELLTDKALRLLNDLSKLLFLNATELQVLDSMNFRDALAKKYRLDSQSIG